MLEPLSKTVPEIVFCIPVIVRKSVDFPIPLAPIKATNFPFRKDKSISEAIMVFSFL